MTHYPQMTRAQIRLNLNAAKTLTSLIQASLATATTLNEQGDWLGLHDKLVFAISGHLHDLSNALRDAENDAEKLAYSAEETAKRESAAILPFRKHKGAV